MVPEITRFHGDFLPLMYAVKNITTKNHNNFQSMASVYRMCLPGEPPYRSNLTVCSLPFTNIYVWKRYYPGQMNIVYRIYATRGQLKSVPLTTLSLTPF